MNNKEAFLLGFVSGFFSITYIPGGVCCLYYLNNKCKKKSNGETINYCD